MGLNPEQFEVVESDLRYPPLRVDIPRLERHFTRLAGAPLEPLRNPHYEDPVGLDLRRTARPSAVLIPIVAHPPGASDDLGLLLTRRHEDISYAGHLCFPGGRVDSADVDARAAALRESREEIALAPERVRLLGRLGPYVTQTGYEIAAFVGVITPPLDLRPRPGEVEEIVEIPLACLFRSDSYWLARHPERPGKAFYILRHGDLYVTGPTVSLMIGLYESLLQIRDEAGSTT